MAAVLLAKFADRLPFPKDVAGFREQQASEGAEHGRFAAAVVAEQADALAMADQQIEMVEGDTVYAEFVEEHGYGVHHFGVLVEDMEEAIAEAEAAGLRMTMDGAGFGRDGDGHYAYLDTEDKLGFTVELIERPEGRVPPEKIYPPPTPDPVAQDGLQIRDE